MFICGTSVALILICVHERGTSLKISTLLRQEVRSSARNNLSPRLTYGNNACTEFLDIVTIALFGESAQRAEY